MELKDLQLITPKQRFYALLKQKAIFIVLIGIVYGCYSIFFESLYCTDWNMTNYGRVFLLLLIVFGLYCVYSNVKDYIIDIRNIKRIIKDKKSVGK